MRSSIPGLFAIIGPALIAISLCGSAWHPSIQNSHSSAAESALYEKGLRLYKAGEFTEAGLAFQSGASRAEADGSPQRAAMDWSNAGGAELAHLDFRAALPLFLKARSIAERYRLRAPLAAAANNLASLYLEMGDPESALHVARDALSALHLKEASAEKPGDDRVAATAKLRYQLATALARLNRFDEAEPIYRQAIEGIAALDNLEETARVLGNFGSDCLEAGRLDEAGAVLSEALRIARLHRLNAAANILRALAKLRARQGDMRSATALFDAAIEAPRGITPAWEIYTDRAVFRLARNDLRGALSDFREARRIAAQMRADIVPADRDRVTLEGNLSRIAAGLVEAGNRLWEQTRDSALLRETFDAAEQDRIWSLRALIPEPNDWRTHLTGAYWDLLAQYQDIERNLLENAAPEPERRASALAAELQHMEAAAANESRVELPSGPSASAFTHVRNVLDAASVLLSFHVAKSGSWLWALDRRGVSVYPIPGLDTLSPAIAEFSRAAQQGDSTAVQQGQDLYRMLFGQVSPSYLAHKRWLLELDGPLYDLPFAALTADTNEWLFQHAALEIVPGALMLEPRAPLEDGPFLGIGDAIYNTADPRWRGGRADPAMLLPRLAETAEELRSCSRAWGASGTQLLTGANANLTSVRATLSSRPSVIHFATHVVGGAGDQSSGLIALSLNRDGGMDLMGPVEVAAHPIGPGLVVMNGCHSARGKALPGAGLMGLTRAWIGAGARSVVATRWDIPDDTGAAMMVEFYRALRARPGRGPAFALQQAQSRLLQKNSETSQTPAVWGAYFVLGRE